VLAAKIFWKDRASAVWHEYAQDLGDCRDMIITVNSKHYVQKNENRSLCWEFICCLLSL